MKRLLSLLFCLLLLTGCSKTPPAPTAEPILPRGGTFQQEKGTPTKESWFPATLWLDNSTSTFAFSFPLLSSFSHTGSYTVEGNLLTASTKDGCIFRFRVEGSTRLLFCKSDSVIPESAAVMPLPEGAVFLWTEHAALYEPHTSYLDPEAVSVPTLPFAGRHYLSESEGFGGDFTIVLRDDGTFTYYVGLLSSYFGTGRWTEEGDIVTLTDDTGLPFVNRFRRTAEDDLLWLAEGSTGFMHLTLSDGTRFLGAPLLYGRRQFSFLDDARLLQELQWLEFQMPEGYVGDPDPETLRAFIASLEQDPDRPCALSWTVSAELYENLRTAVKQYYGLD